jgi:hypothetical protein
LDDYLYKLSVAQIQFLAIDNTHTKYLKGADKKAWNNYAEAYKAQTAFDNFMDSLDNSGGDGNSKHGRMDIPLKQSKEKK